MKDDFAGQDVDQAQMAAGRQAFLEYLPIRQDQTDPNRLYRTFSWGKDVELFILDERQYRSAEAICKDKKGNTISIPSIEGDAACKGRAWPTPRAPSWGNSKRSGLSRRSWPRRRSSSSSSTRCRSASSHCCPTTVGRATALSGARSWTSWKPITSRT